MTQNGKYFYCVAKTGDERTMGPIGMGDGRSEVYTFAHRDVAAVVSDSPYGDFAALPKETVLHSLAIHQFVIEQVMKEFSVVPLKFGTVLPDEAGVREILEKGYPQFARALEAVEGKIELDVVALWNDLPSVLKEIGQQEEIREFKESAARKPPDQMMEAKVALGQKVKAALDRKRERYAEEILEALRGEAEDVCSNDLMDDTMIMNAAFLLDRHKEEDFDEALRSLDARYRDAINFRCVGPLPAYSFSTVEVNKIGFDRIDAARRELGLGREASLAEIKEAHRRLTRQYHPDRNPENPETAAKFQKVSEAYQVLTEYAENYKYPFRGEENQGFISVRVLRLSEMRSMG